MGKSKQVNVRLPVDLVRHLEGIAVVEETTLSDVLRDAAVEAIDRRRSDKEWQAKKREHLRRQQELLGDL